MVGLSCVWKVDLADLVMNWLWRGTNQGWVLRNRVAHGSNTEMGSTEEEGS